MKQQPKAAVLMSTFNGALYVQAQVESIMNQTYPNLHLYIRDDGSTDATPEILEELSGRYPTSPFSGTVEISVTLRVFMR